MSNFSSLMIQPKALRRRPTKRSSIEWRAPFFKLWPIALLSQRNGVLTYNNSIKSNCLTTWNWIKTKRPLWKVVKPRLPICGASCKPSLRVALRAHACNLWLHLSQKCPVKLSLIISNTWLQQFSALWASKIQSCRLPSGVKPFSPFLRTFQSAGHISQSRKTSYPNSINVWKMRPSVPLLPCMTISSSICPFALSISLPTIQTLTS